MLDQWGYFLVEEIVWIKINQMGKLIRTGQTGHWLNHTKEHCLVGVKLDSHKTGDISGSHLSKTKLGIDLDLIVSEVRETSRKPDEIYHMIDRIFPKKSKKLEIFARENNLREGWLSVGNQLPETHLTDDWLL